MCICYLIVLEWLDASAKGASVRPSRSGRAAGAARGRHQDSKYSKYTVHCSYDSFATLNDGLE